MSHHIVIVGGGAGGLELATRLGRTLGRKQMARITLIDRTLTHVWKPLLHEVATGSLDVAANEVNYLAQARWNHFEFQPGVLCGLDRRGKEVLLSEALDDDGGSMAPARRVAYDTLVLAIGSRSADFGVPGVRAHCAFLDTAEEARHFHRRLLRTYLRAHVNSGPGNDQRTALDVVIVGGGATGVELAAELRYASRHLPDYGLGSITPDCVHITVVDRAPRLLAALPERVGAESQRVLEALGIDVRCGVVVKEVTENEVVVEDGPVLPATFVVWAAGIEAPEVLARLDGLATNKRGQVSLRRTLQTRTDDDVFVLGDCGACPQTDGLEEGDEGPMVPPLAQAAQQQARFLEQQFVRRLAGQRLEVFEFRSRGSLVSLADFSAVGNVMGNLLRDVTFEGRLARYFYSLLYRRHQLAVLGPTRTVLAMMDARIKRRREPRLKLH